MIKVAVIDDHAVVRMGIAACLSAAPDIAFTGEWGGGQGAADFVKRVQPDVVLLDIFMPDMDGLDALATIRAVAPETAVIMLTTSAGDNDVYRAMNLGARGYVLKDRDAKSLVPAIRAVAAGGEFFPDDIRALYNVRRMTEDPTPREQTVLELVVDGLSNQEIADRLGLTLGSVKQYIRAIAAKLGAEKRVALATTALKRGFVRR